MRKILIAVFLVCGLCSCDAPRAAKDLVRNKHAQTYVLSKRLQDEDKSNDPSEEQLKDFVINTAKDWESLDKLLNDWKKEE
jgi:hypothetical protein